MEWSLPIELTEKILFNLDGCSLARASLVCKKWNDTIRNLTRLYNFWEICCKREISSARLIKIIDKLFPTYPVSKQGKIDWFHLYRCWAVWSNIKNWDAKARVLVESHDSLIKCLAITGNWIIYGTIDVGKVMAYNCKSKVSLRLYRGQGVTDIDLYNSVNFSSNPSNYFPHDGLLFVLSNYAVVRYQLDETENVGNYMGYRMSKSGFLHEWILDIKNNCALKMDSVGLPYNKCDSWAKWITSIQNVSINLIGEVTFLPMKYNLYNSEGFGAAIEVINYWYQLNYSVLLGIAYRVYNILFFVINGKMKGYLPPDQLFSIKAAFLYCNMLFLGNDRGSVFAYKLNSDEDLLEFNLVEYVKKVDVSNIAITAIDVQYDFESRNKEIPSLVVSTASCIHKIDFK